MSLHVKLHNFHRGIVQQSCGAQKRPHFHSMKGLQGRMGRDGKKRRDGRKREASAEKNGLQGPPSIIFTWGWEYQSPAELLNKVLFPFQELCTFTPNLSLPPDLIDSLHGFLVFHNRYDGLGTIHKGRPQNFRDFGPPPSPCPHSSAFPLPPYSCGRPLVA